METRSQIRKGEFSFIFQLTNNKTVKIVLGAQTIWADVSTINFQRIVSDMLVMVSPFFGRFLLSLRSVQSCEHIYFVPLVSYSWLQDSEESGSRKLRENCVGTGERRNSGARKHCSIPHCVVPENVQIPPFPRRRHFCIRPPPPWHPLERTFPSTMLLHFTIMRKISLL